MQPVMIMSRPEVPSAPQVVYSARGRLAARKPQATYCGSQSARQCPDPSYVDGTRLPALSGRGSPSSHGDGREASPARQAWDRTEVLSRVDASRCDRRKSMQQIALPGDARVSARLALESASRRSTAQSQEGKRPCSVLSTDSDKLADQFIQLYEREDWERTPQPKWQKAFGRVERAALLAEQGERSNRLKILISTGRLAAATQEVAGRAETHEARSKRSHGIDQKVRSNVRAMGEQRLELSSARKDLEVMLKKNQAAKSNVASYIRHLLPTPRATLKDIEFPVAQTAQTTPTAGAATQAQIRAEAAQQPPTYAAGSNARRVASARRWSVEFDLNN